MVGAGTWSPSANPAQHSAPGPGRMGGRAGPGMIAGGCTKAPSHGPVAGADGTYVVADAEQVTLRDARGTVRSRTGGSGFVIAPDGNQIAVYGRDAPRAGRAGAGHGDRAGHDFWHPPRLLRRLLAGRLGDRLREGSRPGRRRVRCDPGGQEVTPIAKSTNGYSVFFSGDGKALVCNGEDQAAGQASWSPGSVEPRR